MKFSHAQDVDCRPGAYVGRVGALAVALGVGAAVLGFAGVAAADTGSPDAGAGDAGRGTASRAADQRSARSPHVSAPAASSEADSTVGRTAPTGQPPVGERAAADSASDGAGNRSARTRAALTPSVAGPQSGPLDGPVAVVGPVDVGNGVRPAAPSPSPETVADVPGVPVPDVTAAQPSLTPVTAQAPVMTAAAADAALIPAGDALDALTVDGGGTPLVATLAFATLAAARREDLAGATTASPAATEETTPEVSLPCVAACVSGLSKTSGAVGDTITLTGNYLGGVTTVKFGCASSAPCGWGVTTTPVAGSVTSTSLQVKVPQGAPTGYIQAVGANTATGRPISPISSQKFTVTGAAPTVTGFTPGTGNIGGGPGVTITGTNFTGAAFVQFGEGQTTSFTVSEPDVNGIQTITAAVPDNATTGPIVVGLPTGGAVSSLPFTVATTALPPKSTCADNGGGYCDLLGEVRVLGVNALSAAIGQLLPSAGPVGKCTADGCPVPYGQTTPSVANTLGIYAFNVVYSLSGSKTPAAAIGQTVVDLVSQPNVLSFISQTVAGNPALAALPSAVATTIGNAAATFVQNSLGTATVATALVPFLKALNLPTSLDLGFVKQIQTDPTAALLSRFNSTQWPIAQAALQNGFFGAAGVQTLLGQAFADSVSGLVNSPVIAGYLGQVAASALLGQQVDATNPLAVTLGGAVGTLLGSIGGTVATDAGAAFTTLLQQPASTLFGGQPAVATTLANVLVNAVVTALGGTAPFPLPTGLPTALAPGAGVAVTGFVNALLTTPGIDPALGTFVTQVTTGVLSDQQLVSQVVGNAVTGFLGGGSSAQVVGNRVGAAAATFFGDPVVSGAVATLVNSVFGAVLGADGVVTALADAAGGLTTAVLAGEKISDALSAAVAAVAATPGIRAAVGPAVTTALATFLGDTGLRSAVDAALSSLVTGLIGDPAVQQALVTDVTTAVSGLLGGGDLGTTVGAQVAAAVVALVTNPTVEGALVGLVDTVFSDFIGAQGVISALSGAAGQLATAAVEGTLQTVQPQVVAALKANPDIDAAIQGSVVAATAQFLGDTAVWSTVDLGLSSLVSELLADTVVQDAISSRVASEVNSLLGFGPISVVGEDVGAAVVALLTDPVVTGALGDLVDTLFSDFFGSDGVVDAISGAAGDVALGVLTGESLNDALTAAGKALRVDPAVDAGAQASVGAAVTQFFGDAALWSTVDAGITALATQLITDPVVQQVLNDRVADEVSALLGGGDLGDVVGAQVAATVVDLLTNPTIGTALLDVVDTVFSDLFGTPGVDEAFGEAAGDLALAALTLSGADFTAAVQGIVGGLRNNSALDTGVQNSVEAAVAQLLGDTAAWTVVDGAISDLLGELIGDTEVQQALAARVANEINSQLGFGPISVVGEQVGAFVVGLLTNPVVAGALPDVVDSVFTDFFGAAGVVDAISGAAGDVALAVLTGESAAAALQDALSGLENNPAIQAGVAGTVDDALNVIDVDILSNTTFQQDLGTDITGLINQLAGDAAVQTLVTDRFGAAIGGLLADTAVVGEVASAVGTAVTGLLGYTGVSTAITDAAALFIDAVLAGTDTGTAAQDAIEALQSAPAVVAGANAVIPPILNTLLGTANIREAIGVVVQQVTLARLEQSWLGIIPFVDRLTAQVAKGTVEDFLTRTAGQELIDSVVVDLVLGLPVADVSNVVVDEILRKPGLQIALGFSLGAGIGSLFGDNIIGDVIGWVAGFPATVVVGVGAAVIGIYQWIIGLFSAAINAIAGPAQAGEFRYLQARTA